MNCGGLPRAATIRPPKRAASRSNFARTSAGSATVRNITSHSADPAMMFGFSPPRTTPTFAVALPSSSCVPQSARLISAIAAIILLIAESPRSGYAECAATPSKRSVQVSAPFDARANFDSVGSPTITYSDPRPANSMFALFAPIESVSSPTTRRNAKSRLPSARNRSPAAIIAAMTPFVSHAPRPWTY